MSTRTDWHVPHGTRLSQPVGKVLDVVGFVIHTSLEDTFIGEICEIRSRGEQPLLAEVVGFRDRRSLMMPLADMGKLCAGAEVEATGDVLKAPVGDGLLGKVIDGLGNPLGDPYGDVEFQSIRGRSLDPLRRGPICQQLEVGIRVIDAMLPIGRGQRIGVFAAAGGGKSTLMGTIAKHRPDDIKVIVLVGERGREVDEFLTHSLGDARRNAVVVVATADAPAVVRMKAAYMGTTIAEHFRDQGRDVILMMDSVTRFARAQREIGLSRGEPPARYGFPPSVFAELPRLFERCGNSDRGAGTMTGLYTVLVEGDNMDEPVADESKSLLDGHIVLSEKIKYRPSVDVVRSISRVEGNLQGREPAFRDAVAKTSAFLKYYREIEDAVRLGFHPDAENLKAMKQAVDAFLEQKLGGKKLDASFVPFANSAHALQALAAKLPDPRKL
jgi:FliI/YscN family ATPase